MTRTRTCIPAESRRRQAVSLLAILSLLIGALMPLAHANAGASGAGTLLAAICSPNGVRYVEIALDPAEPEAPRLPELGTLAHCPGCLVAGGPALLPVASATPEAAGEDLLIPAQDSPSIAGQVVAGFQPRAPPLAS